MSSLIQIILPALVICSFISAQTPFETDTIKTSGGDLEITFIAHGSLRFHYLQKTIYVDPCSSFADYSGEPNADLILVTHRHYDHLDTTLIRQLSKPVTQVIGTRLAADTFPDITVMNNGDSLTVGGIPIQAVPAYNLVHRRTDGQPFHPKGEGNGYVILFGDKSVYVAGDTEDIPEMKNLKDIDMAFLPMNLPYTMDPNQVLSAVKLLHPKVLYPYHTGDTNVEKLVALMASIPEVNSTEVRIRTMP